MPAYAYPVGKDTSVQLKDHERPTSNVQHRILSKVFCLFIKGQSEAIASFDVQRSMFNVGRSKRFYATAIFVNLFSPERSNLAGHSGRARGFIKGNKLK
jgi:hypothetical protein